MIAEAEARRVHLRGHLAELDAGRSGLHATPPREDGCGAAVVTLTSPLRADGLRAFRHRNYRLFYAGQGTSLIGTWMQAIAQAWLVLELTDDPFYLGLVAVAQFAPVLVLGLFGGIVADSLPKRRTLMILQAAMMALAGILFALTATGVIEVWMILVLAFLLGTLNAFEMPVRQAFAVELVGKPDIPSAVGLSASMFNASRILGPAIGGLVIAAAGVQTAFLINALSFGAVLVAYAMMRESELSPVAHLERPRSAGDVFRSLREGLVYVRRTPVVLLGVATVGLVSMFAMNFQVLVPILARDVLDVGAEGFGFLMAASGIGSLIASFWLAFGKGIRPRVVVGGALLIGSAVLALGFTTSYPVAAGLLFFGGMGGIAMAVSANLTNQLTAPDELRGRVIGVHTTIFVGSSPIGGLIAGAIASLAGVEVAFRVGGAAALVVGLIGAIWLRGAIRSGVVVLRPTGRRSGPLHASPAERRGAGGSPGGVGRGASDGLSDPRRERRRPRQRAGVEREHRPGQPRQRHGRDLLRPQPGAAIGRTARLVPQLAADDPHGVHDEDAVEGDAQRGRLGGPDERLDGQQPLDLADEPGLLGQLAEHGGGRVLAEVQAAAGQRPVAGRGLVR